MASRDDILAEIKRLTLANHGKTVGSRRFTEETGISMYEIGRYWARWGDAVLEAGHTPNSLRGKDKDDEQLIRQFADLAVELGHFPTKSEVRLKRIADPNFPSPNTLRNRIGVQSILVRRVREYSISHREYEGLLPHLPSEPESEQSSSDGQDLKGDLGFVYLIKMDKWYKIGFTRDLLRRQGAIQLILPEKGTLIHRIETDDPSGVENYWHRRFADRRTQGEWFLLSRTDVAAFTKWRRIS